MDATEYTRLTEAKKAAAAVHDAGKRRVRERIAAAILKDPQLAIQYGRKALESKTGDWQQWSRNAWEEILNTKDPQEIADILLRPENSFQDTLADSHPFPGLSRRLGVE